MKILICGLDEMRQYQGVATALISIIDEDNVAFVPALGLSRGRRLVLICDDVESVAEAQSRERRLPGSRCIPPTKKMVESAFAFSAQLTTEDTLLVNCGHGISRSTAMAFAVMAQAEPEVPPSELFRRLLSLRRQASPNRLIVKYADPLLGRGGRLTRALGRR